MKKLKRWLSLALALCLMLTLLPTAVFAAETAAGEAAGTVAGDGVVATPVEKPAGTDLTVNTAVSELPFEERDADEMVRVIVVLEEASLLEQGLSRSEISTYSAEAASASAKLQRSRDMVIAQVEQAVARSAAASVYAAVPASEDDAAAAADEDLFTLLYEYDTVVNGFSAEVPYGALEEIQQVEGVAYAFEAPVYEVPKDMGSAETFTISTQDSFGSSSVWNSESYGYTGAGMRVAVIDTGLDLTHPSFAASPELTADSLDLDGVAEVLTSLNAYNIYRKRTAINPKASAFYRSEKVPFAFNYSDGVLDVSHANDMQGDHGTHVAGIVAANKVDGVDVVGVAPDAQLLIMKVFGTMGAPMDAVVAAIDDSVKLGADAINMSLGSAAGFTTDDSDGRLYEQVMSAAEEAGVVLAVAAGNSYSAAYGNGLGTNLNLASDPDIGVVASPSTLTGATSVASVENATIVVNYFTVNGEKIAYNDVASKPFKALAGQTLEYVVIPDGGTLEAFEALAEKAGSEQFLSGKIALIQRGSIAFMDKQNNAKAFGAAAVIIYNNLPGSNPDGGMPSMADSGALPNVGVSLEDGERMVAAAAENDAGLLVGTLTVAPASETTVVSNPISGTMSIFTSWGVTPDLQLMPDVAAPGGNIYSTLDKGTYGMMSGTSMASPHIAGMSALVLQYLQDKHPELADKALHDVAEALIMSTAEPILEDGDVAYSPRRQGAGMANVYRAVSSDAYLTVQQENGDLSPKASLGDGTTGVYSFSFEIHNMGSEAKRYQLSGQLSTDQVEIIDGTKFMGETARALTGTVAFASAAMGGTVYDANEDGVFDLADVQYLLDGVNELFELKETTRTAFDLNHDGALDTADVQLLYELLGKADDDGETVTVAPGQTVTVQVTVTLSQEDKDYISENYANGGYVDGFVRCVAADETGVSLTLPLVGFYGDWSAAPVFDSAFWYEGDDAVFNRYPNMVYAGYGYQYAGLGVNTYVRDDPYSPDHNSLSPDGDGYMDSLAEIQLGMMRGAKAVQITWLDENGNVLHEEKTLDYVRKSYYSDAYGLCIPAQVVAEYLPDGLWDLSGLQNNQKIKLRIEAWLDDGDDVADQTLEFPITIDTEAPKISDISTLVDKDGRRTVTLTATDNVAVSAVVLVTKAIDPIKYYYGDDLKDGGKLTMDVTDCDSSFMIVVCDYAGHEVFYEITFPGVTTVRSGAFYAYRRYCVIKNDLTYYPTNAYNGWTSFEEPARLMDHTNQSVNGDTSVDAAEYIDGYVIGVDVNSTIFACRPGEWNRIELGTLEINGTAYPALDMAFDYANRKLYVLTDNLVAGTPAYLVELDYLTGEVQSAKEITGLEAAPSWYQNNQALTLACDNSGTLYSVDLYNGYLYTLNPATGAATRVGETGYVPGYNQSMTVDHDTDELYWAYYKSSVSTDTAAAAALLRVDKETGECEKVGLLENNAELCGLFKPYDTDKTAGLIPDSNVEVTGLQLSETALTMNTDSVHPLTANLLPYYAGANNQVTWSSSDNSVAVMNENGVVWAKAPGTATVTAACGNFTATCEVTVKNLNEQLYVYDPYTASCWLTMNASDPVSAVKVDGADTYSTGISAAAYFDGRVYAYDFEGSFYKLDAQTLTGASLGQSPGAQLSAMTYDYTSKTMYALNYSASDYYSSTVLCKVSLTNGSYETIESMPVLALGGLAADYDGNLYAIGTNASTMEGTSLVKCRMDTVTNQWGTFTELVTDEPVELPMGIASGFGSLVYSKATNGLYWADNAGELYWISLEDYSMVDLGTVRGAGYNELMGLFLNPGDNEPSVDRVAPESAALDKEIYSVMAGGSTTASVTVEPFNASYDVTYAIADPSVATVNGSGRITGVTPGETTLTVTVTGLEPLTAQVLVTESAGTLYGFVLTDTIGLEDFWAAIPTHDPASAVLQTQQEYPFSIYAGAYYNGYLYAVGQGGSDYGYAYRVLKIDPMDYTCDVLEAEVTINCRDMAFDYTTGTMYVSGDDAGSGVLAQMNLETGEMTVVAHTDRTFGTLAVTPNGAMYGVATSGGLYQVNKITGESERLFSAPSASVAQSMHYDWNSDKIFWAYISSYDSSLYEVDLENETLHSLGRISSEGAEITCLYTVPETEPAVPETVLPSGVSVEAKNYVAVGKTVTLNAVVLPVSVASVDPALTWRSENPDIATVNNGVVTGVSAGTAVITATNTQGQSASCTVTVLAEPREYWAYNDTTDAWFRFDPATGDVLETIQDTAEDTIMASAYIDGTLYAYSSTGAFYAIDTETFQRSEPMQGIQDEMLDAEWGDPYQTEMVDLSYDTATGKLYGLVIGFAMEDWDWDDIPETKWDYAWAVYEIDLTDGTGTKLFQSETYLPGNLLVENGAGWFVDTLVSGVVNSFSLRGGSTQKVLIQGYWGMRQDGRSLLRDELSGDLYVIRGYGSEADTRTSSILYTLNLTTGALKPVTDFGAVNVNSLFIK